MTEDTKFWMPKKLQDLLFTYEEDKIFKVAYGGRYGAKTTAFEFAAIKYILENPGCTFLCVRGTQTSLDNSLLAGIKSIIFKLGVERWFDIGEKYIRTVPINGKVSKFIFMGAQSYENFRSMENISVAWIDEAHVVKEDAWDVIIPSIRGQNSEIWITFNANRKEDWVYKEFILKDNDLARVVKINYTENVMLPKRELLKAKEMQRTNIRKYRHIYLGELDDMPEDALWKQEHFLYKGVDTEDLERIVVALDPSGSAKKSADEAGLVVAGKIGQEGYILADESKKLSQLDQAKLAIGLYHRYQADAVVVEKNGVGAGMKTIIHQIDKGVPVKEVNARRGKILRAEPVSALYEAGRIYHKEIFTDLEYEYTSYTGDPGQKSPNHLDAAVYAITDLLIKKQVIVPEGMVAVDMSNLQL